MCELVKIRVASVDGANKEDTNMIITMNASHNIFVLVMQME